MLYDLFNQISSTLIGPIMDIANGLEHLPFLFAFFLGVVGAVAPCQLTSNVSAITIYGVRLGMGLSNVCHDSCAPRRKRHGG